jgi:citrate synthase
LYYRGQNAIELSRTSTLEEIANLLWDASAPVSFQFEPLHANAKPGRASAFAVLADLVAAGHSTHGRQRSVLHTEAQYLVAQVGEAFGAKYVEGLPLHLRFAKAWRQPLHVANLLRTAMVLLADHELTSSAFASRIAASTGASLPACLLAGLMTLSGPLHGDASGRVSALFGEVLRLGEDHVVDRYLSSALPLAGFGHHIYPDGDPRAAVLLSMFEPTSEIARFIERVTKLTGKQPNIDIALAAMVVKYKLPTDAAFGLFATSRSVGLIAHCIEQLNVPQVIRPRGRYTGQLIS